jgi:septum formation protein
VQYSDVKETLGISGKGGLRVHLASQSPRRRELLAGAGIEHDAANPGVDDGQLCPGTVGPAGWVMALAYLKAATAARRIQAEVSGLDGQSIVVLGADTVVVHRGELMGQPADADDARRMLLAMRDDVHEVVTGVALVDVATGRREMFVDTATVRVGHIPDSEIEAYVRSGAWRGKAGAYNLSERLNAGWPIEFDGDAGTIMGLPVSKVALRLKAWGEGGRGKSEGAGRKAERGS